MKAVASQTHGGILEKVKRYEAALATYSEAKAVVEKFLGTKAPNYIELLNAINGAKLRLRY